MSTPWIILLGLGAVLAVALIVEIFVKRDTPRKSLAQQFGGDNGRDEDDSNLSPEMQEQLNAQMRVTAQAGVQGIVGSFGKSWQVIPQRTIRDRDAYAKLFVPKNAPK